MPTDNDLNEQRGAEVHVDVSTLRGEPRGADTMVYTVALEGAVGDRWIEGYRLTAEQSATSRRFELDPARRIVRFACRTADGNALVFEMLERLESLVASVNRLAEIWRSQAPRVRFAPVPLRAR
jgi:hypothetical protein